MTETSQGVPRTTRVVIRADAGPDIGSGHVMRCAALAEALRARGADVVLLSRGLPPRLCGEMEAIGVATAAPTGAWPDTRDADETIALANDCAGDVRWVVVDGYHFDRGYMRTLVDAGLRVAWIDDLNMLGEFDCDLVINPTLGAEREAYVAASRTRTLMGATYALVRPAFGDLRRARENRSNQIVIMLGGADPQRLTPHVVRALLSADLDGYRVSVVVGPSNPHVDEVRSAAAGASNVEVLHDPADFPRRLADSILVITAAGGATWEVATLGIASVLIVVVESQQRGAFEMADAGAAEMMTVSTPGDLAGLPSCVDALLNHERDRLGRMADRAARIVDGRGAHRVARWIVDGPQAGAIAMRPATRADAIQVWRLNSEPSTRAQSFGALPIPLAGHFDWFDRYLTSSSGRMYLLTRDDEVAAVIRYDRAGSEDCAELSFAVASPFRRLGLGVRALSDTWRAACHELGVTAVRGAVIQGNDASMAAFRHAGFVEAARERRSGRDCVVFERRVA
jgi:UDP-2,4-diacetamido-2,4,6-trideoxy-beta-L-altropyranose hydrolase